jgi:hypothetical protein
MVVIAISLVVCIIGLAMFYFSTGLPAPRGKWATPGLIMFGVGLLVFLQRWSPGEVLGIK